MADDGPQDPATLLGSIFSLIDEDQCGGICLDETRRFVSALPPEKVPGDGVVQELFLSQDKDESGKICADEFCEFARALGGLVGLGVAEMAACFEAKCHRELFDLLKAEAPAGAGDGDAYLDEHVPKAGLRSLLEALDPAAGAHCSQDELQAVFAEHDADGSDSLDVDEFADILRSLSLGVPVSVFVRGFRTARAEAKERLDELISLFGESHRAAGGGGGGGEEGEEEEKEEEGEAAAEGEAEAAVEDGAEASGGDAVAAEGEGEDAEAAGGGGAGVDEEEGAGGDKAPDGGVGGGGEEEDEIDDDDEFAELATPEAAAAAAEEEDAADTVPAGAADAAASVPAATVPPPALDASGEYTPRPLGKETSFHFADPSPVRASSPPPGMLGGVGLDDGGYQDGDELYDDDDDNCIDLDALDVGQRLFYAGSAAERRKMLHLQRERESKVMNELSFMSSPKITQLAKKLPKRTDEFRSTTVSDLYTKRIALEKARQQSEEDDRLKKEMEQTVQMSDKSRRIIETTMAKTYQSPVSDWEAHRDRHSRKYVNRELDRSTFTPNINRGSGYLGRRDKDSTRVFDRLHGDSFRSGSKQPPPALSPRSPPLPPPHAQPQPQQPPSQPPLPPSAAGNSTIIFRKSSTASVSPAQPSVSGASASGGATPREHAPPSTVGSVLPASAASGLQAPPSPAHPDMVVNRLLSAGQETVRKRSRMAAAKEDAEGRMHSFHPSLNQRSVELAEERRRRKEERDAKAADRVLHEQEQRRLIQQRGSGGRGALLRASASPQAAASPHAQRRSGSGSREASSRKGVPSFLSRTRLQNDKMRERERNAEHERRSKEMRGCTFQPMICAQSDLIAKRGVYIGGGRSPGGPRDDSGEYAALGEEEDASFAHAAASGSRNDAAMAFAPGAGAGGDGAAAGAGTAESPAYPSVASVESHVFRGSGGGAEFKSLTPMRSKGAAAAGAASPEAADDVLPRQATTSGVSAASGGGGGDSMSPFDRAAPSRELGISAHSIEREISAVLDEWNRIQDL